MWNDYLKRYLPAEVKDDFITKYAPLLVGRPRFLQFFAESYLMSPNLEDAWRGTLFSFERMASDSLQDFAWNKNSLLPSSIYSFHFHSPPCVKVYLKFRVSVNQAALVGLLPLVQELDDISAERNISIWEIPTIELLTKLILNPANVVDIIESKDVDKGYGFENYFSYCLCRLPSFEFTNLFANKVEIPQAFAEFFDGKYSLRQRQVGCPIVRCLIFNDDLVKCYQEDPYLIYRPTPDMGAYLCVLVCFILLYSVSPGTFSSNLILIPAFLHSNNARYSQLFCSGFFCSCSPFEPFFKYFLGLIFKCQKSSSSSSSSSSLPASRVLLCLQFKCYSNLDDYKKVKEEAITKSTIFPPLETKLKEKRATILCERARHRRHKLKKI